MVRQDNKLTTTLGLIGLAAAGGFLILGITGTVVVVPAGERAAVFNSFTGVEQRTLPEGAHLLTPFIEHPILYDVRTQTYTMSKTADEGQRNGDDSVTALSADGQKVHIDVSIRYHLDPKEISQLHDQIGPDYLEKVIRPEAQTVIRNIISGYTVTQLYSAQRLDIQQKMSDQIQKTMNVSHIMLDELLLRNIAFSDAFASAIEQKQVALQEAERMKYVLQKEEAEKQRKIIAATGDSESMRLRANALKQNPQLVQWEYVQKLAPNVKAVIADQKMLVNLGTLLASEEQDGRSGHQTR